MGEPERSIDGAVRTLVRLSRLLERADAGVSLAQFRILELVARGTRRSTHIASRLATSKPAVTTIVDTLVGAGLLTRTIETGDRRAIRLALTPKGRRALTRAERAYRDRLTPLLDQISDPDGLLCQLAEIDQVMDARWDRRPQADPPAEPARPRATGDRRRPPAVTPTTSAAPTPPSTPEVPLTR